MHASWQFHLWHISSVHDVRMQALNLTLYDWIAGADDPSGILLWLAEHGASLAAVLVAWVILRRPKERWYAGAIVLAAGLTSMLAHALADGLGFERPYMQGLGAPRIPHGARGALPSAHATVMFTVALLLWLRPALRIVAGLALLLAALTSWGRIYAGVHFPIDIAAGALVALLIATSVHLVARRLPKLLAARMAARPLLKR
jgi:undecaprenyl-diphosphatase